jgi:hypothetical protein
MIIIIKLRYSVSFSSTCTTKILHLTSSFISANLINLIIRPTSWLEAIRCYIKLTSLEHNTRWSPKGFSCSDVGWGMEEGSTLIESLKHKLSLFWLHKQIELLNSRFSSPIVVAFGSIIVVRDCCRSWCIEHLCNV